MSLFNRIFRSHSRDHRPRDSAETCNTLIECIAARNVDRLRALLKEGAAVDGEEGSLLSPLIQAATSGCAEMMGILLDNGADPEKEIGGETPLTAAIGAGNNEVVELLLRRGASTIHEPALAGKVQTTPLSKAVFAGNLDAAKLILDHGIDGMDIRRFKQTLASARIGSTKASYMTQVRQAKIAALLEQHLERNVTVWAPGAAQNQGTGQLAGGGIASIKEAMAKSHRDLLGTATEELIATGNRQLQAEGADGSRALAGLIGEVFACRNRDIWIPLKASHGLSATPELVAELQRVSSAPALAPEPRTPMFAPELTGQGQVGWSDRTASYARKAALEARDSLT